MDRSIEIQPEDRGHIVSDLFRGIVDGMIDDPINGITQLTNATGLTKLPELHIVDDQSKRSPAATVFGKILGHAVDVGLATQGLGSLPIRGIKDGFFFGRVGIAGAMDGALFQPSWLAGEQSNKSLTSIALTRLGQGALEGGGLFFFSLLAQAAADDSLYIPSSEMKSPGQFIYDMNVNPGKYLTNLVSGE